MPRASVVVTLFAVAACGSSDNPPADPAPEWQPLITNAWELEPGTENTSDIQLQALDTDYFVGGIRPIAPPGTHHTLLIRGGGGSGTIGLDIVYASGVGTNGLDFPPGVGLRLNAGMVLALQLHVFNTTEQPLSGSSGIEVLPVNPASITDQVDLLLAGPTELALPPGESTVTGTCTLTERQTVFALFPHMHQMGTHLKSTFTVGGVDQVLHDGPYEFEDQAFLPIEPVVLEPGDQITTECTYYNETSETVGWGESSTTEMCFSIVYRFPAGSGSCAERD